MPITNEQLEANLAKEPRCMVCGCRPAVRLRLEDKRVFDACRPCLRTDAFGTFNRACIMDERDLAAWRDAERAAHRRRKGSWILSAAFDYEQAGKRQDARYSARPDGHRITRSIEARLEAARHLVPCACPDAGCMLCDDTGKRYADDYSPTSPAIALALEIDDRWPRIDATVQIVREALGFARSEARS